MPNLYIIAGPNGAGKTTFAREFLPNDVHCLEFVNADLIATGLSPFAPEKSAIQAGRLMLEKLEALGNKGVDFAFETTLSGKSYLPFLRRLKERGYQIHLDFVWLSEVELAVARVADRVAHGGHNVPADDVRRRYHRGLHNLFNHYRPLLDSWIIFDNTEIIQRPNRRSSRTKAVANCTLSTPRHSLESMRCWRMPEQPTETNLFDKAERALKRAVAKLVEERRRLGEPIVTWRDGKVVKLKPEAVLRESRAQYPAREKQHE